MHQIHTKAMENSRKSACSAIDIIEWFELLKKCKEEFDIQDVEDDFLCALLEIKKLAFKKSTIRSGFRDTGIVPFNPNYVLEIIG
jgi:hypothetical protein